MLIIIGVRPFNGWPFQICNACQSHVIIIMIRYCKLLKEMPMQFTTCCWRQQLQRYGNEAFFSKEAETYGITHAWSPPPKMCFSILSSQINYDYFSGIWTSIPQWVNHSILCLINLGKFWLYTRLLDRISVMLFMTGVDKPFLNNHDSFSFMAFYISIPITNNMHLHSITF